MDAALERRMIEALDSIRSCQSSIDIPRLVDNLEDVLREVNESAAPAPAPDMAEANKKLAVVIDLLSSINRNSFELAAAGNMISSSMVEFWKKVNPSKSGAPLNFNETAVGSGSESSGS